MRGSANKKNLDPSELHRSELQCSPHSLGKVFQYLYACVIEKSLFYKVKLVISTDYAMRAGTAFIAS